MIRPGTLGFRLVAFALIWIAGALIAGGVLLGSLFETQVRSNFDSRIAVLLETLVTVTDADPRPACACSAPRGASLRAPVLGLVLGDPLGRQGRAGLALAVGPDAGTARHARNARRRRARPLRHSRPARPEAARDRAAYQFRRRRAHLSLRSAGDLAEVAAEIRPFRVTLAWSLGVLGLGLVAAVLLQVHFGLEPLRKLRIALARIRAGRAERIEGDFPGEVRPLVEEANALIAHIGEVVERARTHVGNLAHALKTPLSVLANEAGAGEGPLAETVARETRLMQTRIDHHLARARTAASAGVIGQRAEVRPVIDALARTLAKMYADKGLSFDSAVEDGLAFRGDAQDLEEMLGNLMENACKWATSKVRVYSGHGRGTPQCRGRGRRSRT